MLTLGVLGAIHTPPREKAREIRDAYAERLLGQDVVDPRWQVRDLLRKPLAEAARDLAQEYARLRTRIQKPHHRVGPDVRAIVDRRPRLSQRVEHAVREFRRREHL